MRRGSLRCPDDMISMNMRRRTLNSQTGRLRRRAVSIGALMLMLSLGAVMFMLLKFRAIGGRFAGGHHMATVVDINVDANSFNSMQDTTDRDGNGVEPSTEDTYADGEDEEDEEDRGLEVAGRFVAMNWKVVTIPPHGPNDGVREEEVSNGMIWKIESHVDYPGNVVRWGYSSASEKDCMQDCEVDPACNIFVYCDEALGDCGAMEKGTCWLKYW